MSIKYERLNEYELKVLGSDAEGVEKGVRGNPRWLVAMSEAEIPGAVLGDACGHHLGWLLELRLVRWGQLIEWCLGEPLSLAAIICKRLCCEFYEASGGENRYKP